MRTMTPGRRSMSVAALVIGAMISLVASPAAAAEPPTIVIPTVDGVTSESWQYRNNTIDPGTTALKIHTFNRVRADPVDCTLNGYEFTPITVSFTAEEWDAPGPAVMNIPAGALSGADELTCTSAGDDTRWSSMWMLHIVVGGGDTVRQEGDRMISFVIEREFKPGPSHEIFPGATVLLAGQWVNGNPEEGGYSGASLISSDRRFASIGLPVTFDSAGEYGMVVRIPADLPAGFTDAPATLTAESGWSRETEGTERRITSWSGPVHFAEIAESSTALALERRFGTSRERLTASASVTTTTGVVRAGTMDFYLNTKLVGSVTVDGNGKASTVLPRLPRGKHFVVATFRGTNEASPSSSTPLSVRILL